MRRIETPYSTTSLETHLRPIAARRMIAALTSDMDMSRESPSIDEVDPRSGNGLRPLVSLLWQLIRVPVYLVLAILEPIVSLALSFLVLIALFTAVLFRFADPVPHFPVALTLGLALGCALLLGLYHGLMALFAAR